MSTVIRWNPIREMAAMQSAMDRLFDETWRSTSNLASALPLDIIESAEHYTVVTELPGLDAEQINVSMHDGVLTISGEVHRPELPENHRVLLQERTYGKFSRSVNLPQPVNTDEIEAEYTDGILRLSLPKSAEAKPRTIPVKSGRLLHSEN